MSVKRICECIIRDEKSILPVSTVLQGTYGIEDVALSMPTIVGFDGVETHVPISLDQKRTRKIGTVCDDTERTYKRTLICKVFPSGFSAWMLPLWFSTMEWAMERPMPEPPVEEFREESLR